MKKACGIVALILAVTWAIGSSASAQYLYETPNGYQTIGPAQMGQQPSLSEEFFKHATGTTVAPTGIYQPGVPGVQIGPGPGPTQLPANTIEGGASSISKQATSSTSKQSIQPPQAAATVSGGTAQPGSIIYPQGESSMIRIGPVWQTSMATRVVLGAWLLLQLVVIAIVAFALQFRHSSDEQEFQGGHTIQEDYRQLRVS